MTHPLFHSARLLAIAVLLSVPASTGLAQQVTTEALLREMSDLAKLAEFPQPAYTTRQFSSHDPSSTSPSDPKTWFANEDWDHWHGTVQRNGRTEYVMMHADGPGAVVRIWSANPAGTLRVYIDGSQEPALEATMADLLAGKVKGIPEPIAGVHSKGYNLYLPMPYARSCEVTADQKGFYYTVDYRTYAAGAEVASFRRDDVQRLSAAISDQAKRLAAPDKIVAEGEQTRFDVTAAPGATITLGRLAGARAIDAFRVQIPKGASDAALRAAVLRMTFDGETTVEVPLGDFFGSAPGLNAFQSLPLGMTADGQLRSNWVMPFRESAVVEIKNLGGEPLALSGEIGSAARPWTDRSMHFNAGFRAEANRSTRPMFDWNYLTATGKGVFVGASFAIDNPSKDWWGEGDEKFYVDGETQPSWFGTGSEDYYGYAWCWPGLFHHAYHDQPRCDGPGNYGRTSVNRFHIMDNVPFNTSFKFDIEMWHWKECKVNMAATTYWYAMPGGKDAFSELTAADVVVHPMPPYTPMVVAGAIEGESMRVLSSTGEIGPQEWSDLSGDKHLWWRGAHDGDKLVVEFQAPAAGRYRVRGRFLKASDYGIARLAVNDQPIDRPFDFYNRDVVPTDEIDLGTFELAAGANKLTVTAAGTNPAGKHQHLFGLDYLKLEPASAK